MHCELCGKTTVFGKKVAHNRMYVAGKTSRSWKPNLHTMTVATETGRKKMTVCTACMRTVKKKAEQA